MTNDGLSRRPVLAAATTASLLMLVFGLTYRALAARLAGDTTDDPIAPTVLEALPMQIGDWTGQDVPLDAAIVRATDTDAHINRRYSRYNGLQSISFYVACGTNARRLLSHRPENCYTSAGWTLMDSRSTELTLPDGAKLPCSVMQFLRGGLNTQRTTVINYFVVDGQHFGDFSAILSKIDRRFAAIGYVLQVQIAASGDLSTAALATTLPSAFAVDSAPFVSRLIETIERQGSSGNPLAPAE